MSEAMGRNRGNRRAGDCTEQQGRLSGSSAPIGHRLCALWRRSESLAAAEEEVDTV